ncbi:MAG: outer membrane protein assembly factor BamD, partial [Rhodospirillales bacterium]|nr:outer membrane protein assembly factor BamD [Rhodospirillales bacterium]
ARLLRGDAKTTNLDYYQALFDYEDVIRNYPDSEQFLTAVQREYEIARLFSRGMKRRLWGMRILDATAEGEELFIRIQERVPGSALGEKASLELADFYFRQADLVSAAEAYELFLLNYPRSTQREWASLRLIQSNLARFKGPQFDPTGLLEARERLDTFIDEYPATAEEIGAEGLLIRIEESLARKDFLTAEWYETRGERVSTVYLFKRIIEDYPKTTAAKDAYAKLEEMDALPKPEQQKEEAKVERENKRTYAAAEEETGSENEADAESENDE